MKPTTLKTLSLLQERGNRGLSTLELRAAGINCPASRILELRSIYNIDAVWCWDSDQQMTARKVMRYFYVGERHEQF